MKTKQKPVEPTSAWWCETCKNGVEMDKGQMLEHLRIVHSLETKGLKCNRKMMLHLDCADSYSSQYEVTIKRDDGDVVLTNSTTNPRRSGDWMKGEE